MLKTLLRHTLITTQFWHFSWLPYLYTFSLCENASFINVSAETEYISTSSWYRNINFLRETWRVYYKWKELLNLREPMCSPRSALGSVVLIVLDFFVVLCFVCLEKKHKLHTIGTVQKYNRKIVVICKMHTPNINILPLLFFFNIVLNIGEFLKIIQIKQTSICLQSNKVSVYFP